MDFARQPNSNFTVILGANGAGKTNLMNAITWCLFGEELHIDSKYEAGLPLENTTALDNSDGKPVETSVELQFIHDDGKKILIKRQELVRKTNSGKTLPFPTPAPFSIMLEGGRDWVGPIEGDEAKNHIEQLIPPDIEEYFFFDGERMDTYFTENTVDEIKNAVFKISQLELLKKMITHLTARRYEYLKSARGLSSKAKDIKETIEILERSLEVDMEQLQEFKNNEFEARKQEQFYSEKLKSSSLASIQKLEDQRVELDNDLLRIKEEIEEYTREKIRILHSNMASIFCFEAIEKAKDIIDNNKEAGIIPPHIRSIFIEGLLKRGKCICKSDISEKNEYSLKRRKNVKHLLEMNRLSEMSDEIVNTNIELTKKLKDLPDFELNILDISKKIRNLQDIKERKDVRIKRITEEIEKSNIESVREWEQNKQRFTKERQNFEVMIAVKKRDIERRENIIRAKRKELTHELGKEKKHNQLRLRLDFCDRAIKAAENIQDKIMQKMKTEIEKRTSEQFLKMIWKKQTYTGVEIDDNYNISVPHVSGREAIGTLSAGERQVCALSFMAALNSVSGFSVPVIIDTLLARISSEPRKKIAQNLSKFFENRQVILLVTEEEYTSEVEKALGKTVGKKYQINFIEKAQGGLAEVLCLND